MKEELFALSAYATVRWDAGEACAGSLLRQEVLSSANPILLHVMQAFARPRTVRDVVAELAAYDASDVEEVAGELVTAGILVSSEPPCCWEPADLAFHLATTNVAGPVKRAGANPAPAVRPRFAGERLVLPRGPIPAAGTVAEALGGRRSVRRFADRPMAHAVFAELLERAASDGRADAVTVRRPYPSGGATYSLEIYLAVPEGAVEDVAGGVYHYHSGDHHLERLGDAAAAAPFVEDSAMMTGRTLEPGEGPPVVILVTSRFRRTRAWYSTIAYRLVLLEVGTLIQSLYLAAHALDVGVCALGDVCAPDALNALAGLDPLEEPVVAALIVGVPRSEPG